MPVAATKSKAKEDKPRAIPAQIQDAHRRMKREALGKWRAWTRAVADDNKIPDPIELLAVGTLLKIPAPADALEQDAEAIREVEQAENAITLCRAERDRLAAPWGGDRQKLAAAVEAAKAEATRLRDILDAVDNECSAGYWLSLAGQIRGRHRRAFVEFEEQLVAQGEDQE